MSEENDTFLTGEVDETVDNTTEKDEQPQGEQPSESGNPESEPQEKKAEPADVVPEQYDFKAPDGMEFDAEVIGAYAEAAKEAGLSQEKADIILGKLAPVMAERQAQAMREVSEAWKAQAQEDKEFGGEKLNENLGLANKALKEFGTPELVELLNKSGLGNNPEVIRFMYRAGKAISQDGFVSGGKAAAGSFDARNHYPASNMNP